MTDGVWSTLLCSGELTRGPARGRLHSADLAFRSFPRPCLGFSIGPIGKRCRSTLTSGAELVAPLLLSLCLWGRYGGSRRRCEPLALPCSLSWQLHLWCANGSRPWS